MVTRNALETLVVQPPDSLGEETARRRDRPGVVRDERGKEGVGEARQELELAALDDRVEEGALALEVLGRSSVVGDAVALADVSAGELDAEAVGVVGQRAELVRVEVDSARGAAEVSHAPRPRRRAYGKL